MATSTPAPRRLVLISAAGVLALGVLAGCSSDSTASTESAAPSNTASAAYCASVDAVASSLDALVNTKVLQEGTDALKSRFDTFRTDVRALTDSARAEFVKESTAVDASVATLQTAVTSLKDSPSAAQAASLKVALQGVSTSTKALVDAVKGACPTK